MIKITDLMSLWNRYLDYPLKIIWHEDQTDIEREYTTNEEMEKFIDRHKHDDVLNFFIEENDTLYVRL